MEIVEGPRLWWIVGSLCIALLLSSLESTIVSTALVSIASDFNNYGQSNWVIITYLLTYSSFLFIFARLSDIVGRKTALLTSLCTFCTASLACGLAKTLTQLIVFRAFQGIGGAGVYALTMVLTSEITPQKHIGGIYAMVNVVFVVASAIGPVVGGAITTYSTWRWCFLLNVPSGFLVITTIAFIFPKMHEQSRISFKDSLRRVDWLGLLLILGASIIIIFPIQEGGVAWAWDSSSLIAMICVGAMCWVAFASWEFWLSRRPGERVLLPMLPHHVALHRIIGTCIITSFLTGVTFTSIVVYLPQRFQAVNGLSPVKSGINILPVLLVSALAAVVSGIVLSKKNLCSYLIVAANAFQLIGLGLLSSLPTTAAIAKEGYGYQAILGCGTGTALISAFVLTRIEVDRKLIAPTVGMITQLRVFGGVVGVVICRVAQSAYLRRHLAEVVSPATLATLMSSVASIGELPARQAAAVRQVYGGAFNWQYRILTFIAAANVLVALFTFRRHPKPLKVSPAPAVEESNDRSTTVGSDAADGQTHIELVALEEGRKE